MKNIQRLVAVAAIGLSVCGLAMAQVSQNGNSSNSDSTQQHHMDPATMVKHLSEVFPQVAAFDLNKDGKLDDTEKQAFGKALADGKLQLAPYMPADSAKESPEMMRNHIAEMYALVSTYDVDKNGKLDETEQATLKGAIEKGEFAPHLKPPHEGGHHHQ